MSRLHYDYGTHSVGAPNNNGNSPLVLNPIQEASGAQVELFVRCTFLIPYEAIQVAFFMMDGQTPDSWREISRTETTRDRSDRVDFATTFLVDYRFHELQFLKFVVIPTKDPTKIIGEMRCHLGEIVGSDQTLTRNLTRIQGGTVENMGSMQIVAEESKIINEEDSEAVVSFNVQATKLLKKSLIFSPDTYFGISRSREENDDMVLVYQSPVVKSSDRPTWKPFSLSVQKLCNRDYDRVLRFEVFQQLLGKKDRSLGYFKTTLRELESTRLPVEFAMYDSKTHNPLQSTFIFTEIQEREQFKGELSSTQNHTFLEYVAGGCDISLIMAIDFTVSNGNPSSSKSLHYNGHSAEGCNEYVDCILDIGQILIQYDADKSIPVLGFGGKPNPSQPVSHCFPLTGSFSNPSVKGIEGVLDVYQKALGQIELAAPTTFSEVIQFAAKIASKTTAQQQKYFVLLILTDGAITTGNNTQYYEDAVREITKASKLPLSIIIVGVGQEDFSQMIDLCNYQNSSMYREIVQFVPYSQFKNAPPGRLASEVLKEIPSQLLTYFQKHNIKPNVRKPKTKLASSGSGHRKRSVSSSALGSRIGTGSSGPLNNSGVRGSNIVSPRYAVQDPPAPQPNANFYPQQQERADLNFPSAPAHFPSVPLAAPAVFGGSLPPPPPPPLPQELLQQIAQCTDPEQLQILLHQKQQFEFTFYQLYQQNLQQILGIPADAAPQAQPQLQSPQSQIQSLGPRTPSQPHLLSTPQMQQDGQEGKSDSQQSFGVQPTTSFGNLTGASSPFGGTPTNKPLPTPPQLSNSFTQLPQFPQLPQRNPSHPQFPYQTLQQQQSPTQTAPPQHRASNPPPYSPPSSFQLPPAGTPSPHVLQQSGHLYPHAQANVFASGPLSSSQPLARNPPQQVQQPPSPESVEQKVEQLVQMGFEDREKVLRVLSWNNGDLERALNQLLGD